MTNERFMINLFRELGRLYDDRQKMLEEWQTLSQEQQMVRRRIELLRELLMTEGADVTLPDIFRCGSTQTERGANGQTTGGKG
jgi:hypothetical protein